MEKKAIGKHANIAIGFRLLPVENVHGFFDSKTFSIGLSVLLLS